MSIKDASWHPTASIQWTGCSIVQRTERWTVQPWGQSYSHTDNADDVAFISELLSLLLSALKMFADEAIPVGLTVNWKKAKVQSLSDFLPPVPDLTVSSISAPQSAHRVAEISRRLRMAGAAMRDLERI